MDLGTTHYSLAQKPDELSKWAKSKSEQLLKLKKCSYIFCYTGYSGAAHVTALMLEYSKLDKNFGMIYVRKKHEKHHHYQNCEYALLKIKKEAELVFVDDFVECGDTRFRTLTKSKLCVNKNYSIKLLPTYVECLRKRATRYNLDRIK